MGRHDAPAVGGPAGYPAGPGRPAKHGSGVAGDANHREKKAPALVAGPEGVDRRRSKFRTVGLACRALFIRGPARGKVHDYPPRGYLRPLTTQRCAAMGSPHEPLN